MINIKSKTFYGVGVGPGDPELITLKAIRLIQQADVISYISNDKGESQSKNIAIEALKDIDTSQIEVPVIMPMCVDRTVANKIYDKAAEKIKKYLAAGKTVVFLCEGDPLFFGSFTYLLERVEPHFDCQVVAGISSIHAASAGLATPLTLLKESLAIINGQHSDDCIRQALNTYDSVVLMKVGRERSRLLRLLEETGRSNEARYLEYIGHENEYIVDDVSSLGDDAGVYFSLFMVVRKERDTS